MKNLWSPDKPGTSIRRVEGRPTKMLRSRKGTGLENDRRAMLTEER